MTLNLSNQPVRDCSKSKSLYNKRVKLSQRQKGEISAKVRDKVNARTIFAPVGCCECCLKNRHGFMRLELAHIESRRAIDHKTTEFDLVRLCGPSTDVKTCHGKAHTGEGKVWMYEFQNKLFELSDHLRLPS
jgi:hypothetical protein